MIALKSLEQNNLIYRHET